MKKRTLGLWIASSICAASLVGAVGCGGVSSPEFKPSYTGHWNGAHDYNIQFDGVLDEDIWQDKGWYRDTFASNYSALFAAVVLTVAPTILIFIVLQKQVIESLTEGAVKG